jgi:DNA-directed RNA polymerase specialized sigma24 family protein
MQFDLTGSMVRENEIRMEVLYKKHHNWLLACGKNIAADIELAQDLVGDLYVYLGSKVNPNIWYMDSFNLQYCRSFLSTRFLNYIKRNSRVQRLGEGYDRPDEEYNTEFDERLETEYHKLVDEIAEMKKKNGWQSAILWEMYMFSEDTMDSLAKKIGLSKSTVYLNTKKVKEHMRSVLDNPFKIKD